MRSFFLLLLFLPLAADELTFDPPIPWETPCTPTPLSTLERGFVIDLKQPIYEQGVLYTTKGGVLTSTDLFIQARSITYDREQGKNILYCEGDILLDYRGQVLVGDSFYFDFNNRTGVLTCGTTFYFPWQIGAQTIRLLEDGSLKFEKAYITTSEGSIHDISLHAEQITINCQKQLATSSLQVRRYDTLLFPLPAVTLDLTEVKRPAIAMKFGWGGYLGPHVSLRYHALTYGDFKAWLRADAFIKHGAGVGIETALDPACSPLSFYTRNYWAHDLAIDDPTKRDRYRFQGTYYNHFFDNRTTIEACYDFVSDAQMAADYTHESFNLNPAQETLLRINHRESGFLTNFIVEVRANSFQTVDQQLPTLEWNVHPVRLPLTNCIFENYIKLSNINFVTSHDLVNKTTEHAARLDIRPVLYWPLSMGAVTLTPKAGLIGIGYSNSPEHTTQNQILGHVGAEAITSLHQEYGWGRHLLFPHLRYTHLTTPTSSLHEHFIFTIDDAYIRFDEIRFGLKQLFFFPWSCRPLTTDIWANVFVDSENGIQTLPKSYFNAEWQLLPTLYWQMDLGIHYEKQLLDFCNTRIDWALSEHASLSLEYRQRSAYAWRKGDFYNFILDVARNEDALFLSTLSDKRRTLLATLFYRVNPDWTIKFISRYGRHARQHRSYFEYEIESRATIADHWWLSFNYQKRESDTRFAFSLKLDSL
jgi:hypothetical protein